LAAVEPIDRFGHFRPTFPRQKRPFGVMAAGERSSPNLVRMRRLRGDEPPFTADECLSPVEAAIDENAREPDLKRPLFTIRSDVREHFDERVLHGFVGFGGVAQILKRDSRRSPLVQRDQLAKPFARTIHFIVFNQAPDLDGKLCVLGNTRGRIATNGSDCRDRQ
jgi:hypothetical protein